MASADQLVATLDGIQKNAFSNDGDRGKVYLALMAALRRVQTPWEVVLDHVWQEPLTKAMIKTLINAKLWVKWVEERSGKPSTTAELAELTSFDPVILKRILRLLAGQHFITETGDGDTYELTDFSRSLGGPLIPYTYTFLEQFHQPVYDQLPSYFAKHNYKGPAHPRESPAAEWLKGEDFFSFLSGKPELADAFNRCMTAFGTSKDPWTETYPVAQLFANAKPGRAFVVDVAGGIGHDLESVRKLHPSAPQGALVLQDLPHVIEKAQVQAPIEKQAIDLFEPQPVKKAQVYYLHVVLHDWPDSKAVEILRNIAAVMEPGYSKILIHEHVVLPKNQHPRIAIGDLTMMMTFGAGERSAEQWTSVVEQAGLKVVKFWSVAASPESVIEVMLP